MQRPRRFGPAEDGGITAFGIIAIGLMLLTMGVAIDVANLYRYKAKLQIAADAAAQSGVVVLARGGDVAEALDAAEGMIERNLSAADYSQTVLTRATDLKVMHYDPATGRLGRVDPDAPANAVVVRLQRGDATGNPLPTFLMGMAGHDTWSLASTSVAVLMPTQRCGNAEGIVAHGAIDLGPAPTFSDGFCLHSQTAIALPLGARAEEPLRLSLPDPSLCEGVCTPGTATTSLHSDFRPMALNLVMPETRAHVVRLAAGFVDPSVTLPEETDFFATRPLDGDPEALREVGLSADHVRKGDVLHMTPLQFSQMRERPAGLVYDVQCNRVEDDTRPVWERTLTLMGNGAGPTLRNLVLVTDCSIELDENARIEGALIFMTGPDEARITAAKGATLGDPKGACDPARRVRLMAPGDLALPADLALSNVSTVAGGNIRLEERPDLWSVTHTGLILRAGGAVTAQGDHSFVQCASEPPSDPLMPMMQVIAYAMPDLTDVLPSVVRSPRKTDLPGKAVKRLPGEAGGRMRMDSETGQGS